MSEPSNVVGAKFGGTVSPASMLANALSVADKMDVAVMVSLSKEGSVTFAWSRGASLTILGLATALQSEIEFRLRERSF